MQMEMYKVFMGKMIFYETLIPYENDVTWISNKIKEMIKTMNSYTVPDSHESCENCA